MKISALNFGNILSSLSKGSSKKMETPPPPLLQNQWESLSKKIKSTSGILGLKMDTST